MVALIFLVLSFLFGSSLLRKTRLQLNAFELGSGGILLGSLVTTWAAFLLSLFFGQTEGIPISLLVMGLTTVSLLMGKKQAITFPKFSARQTLTYLGFTIFWIGILLPLFTSHMLERKTDGLYSGGGTWGDLALHSTFIEKFSGSNIIDLTSPIYAQDKTTYPFLFDYYASIFVRYGSSIQAALVLSGFLFSMIFLQLAFFFVYRCYKSVGAASTFTLLFLFNGGIGAWYALQDWMANKTPLLKFLFTMNVEYAHLAVYGLRFSNLIADYVLPQRAFLVGLPAFALVLIILRAIWVAKEEHLDHKLLLAVTVGLLPFFHIHTFLASVGLILFTIAAQVLIQRKNPRSWLFPLMILAGLAFPQLKWQFSHTFSEGFVRFQYGWMKGEEDILVFWLRNLGLETLFFVIGGTYFLIRQSKQRFVQIVFAALTILFVITNLVIFQPHDYDNMKLMIFSHFAIALVSTWILLAFWKSSIFGKILATLLFVGLTLTGGLSVLRETYTSWQIANNSDLQIARVIKEKTEASSIFLTADSHNHPVTMLAGRSVIMGYRGWLWTHGINYAQTERDVVTMFSGSSESRALFDSYHISYVYVGGAEVSNFDANLQYFRQNYPVVFENQSGIIFDVRGSPLPAIANTTQ